MYVLVLMWLNAVWYVIMTCQCMYRAGTHLRCTYPLHSLWLAAHSNPFCWTPQLLKVDKPCQKNPFPSYWTPLKFPKSHHLFSLWSIQSNDCLVCCIIDAGLPCTAIFSLTVQMYTGKIYANIYIMMYSKPLYHPVLWHRDYVLIVAVWQRWGSVKRVRPVIYSVISPRTRSA